MSHLKTRIVLQCVMGVTSSTAGVKNAIESVLSLFEKNEINSLFVVFSIMHFSFATLLTYMESLDIKKIQRHKKYDKEINEIGK